jgi:hypothetical protein
MFYCDHELVKASCGLQIIGPATVRITRWISQLARGNGKLWPAADHTYVIFYGAVQLATTSCGLQLAGRGSRVQQVGLAG